MKYGIHVQLVVKHSTLTSSTAAFITLGKSRAAPSSGSVPTPALSTFKIHCRIYTFLPATSNGLYLGTLTDPYPC